MDRRRSLVTIAPEAKGDPDMLAGQMMQAPLLISGILRHAALCFPDQEIVSRTVEGPIHRYSYADAWARSNRLAHALAALGVKEGDRIATFAWNGYRHFELYYAISGMGAVCHTMNPRLFEDQIAYIVGHAADRFVFLDLNIVPILEKLADRLPSVEGYVIMTDRAHMPRTSLTNVLCYEELLAQAPEAPFPWPQLDENAAAAMCYTSGTTGNPKGTLYSHRSTVLHAMGLLAAGCMEINVRSTVMPVVPMFHVQAWGQPYVTPICGARLVLPGAKLDGESLHDLMDSEKVTVTLGVPTIWLNLLAYLRQSGKRLDHLKNLVSGGSAAPVAMLKAYEKEYGVNVLQGWGMTETSPVCSGGSYSLGIENLDEDALYERKLRQRKFFGVDMRLMDDDGREVPWDGESQGELQVRGPWVGDGYYNDAKATAAAMTADGWFRTGDVATLDREGLLQITDRTKDLIKSGGEWISSIDLESAAMGHPDVLEAAAIAMPHEKWVERPMLVILPHEGRQPSPDDIRGYLDGRIASWWMPDDIVIVDDIPHTATGKVSKLTLRQRFRDHKLPTD